MNLLKWLMPKSGAGGLVKDVSDGVVGLASGLKEVISGEAGVERLAEMAKRADETAAKSMEAQARITEAEAKHTSLFVAGARPFLLWICGLAVAYKFVARPVLSIWLEAPDIDAEALWPLMTAILGLGGLRTYEKKQGVQDRH